MPHSSFARLTLEPTGSGGTGAYLLIITSGSSYLRPLPGQGSLTIGRTADCEIQLEDGAVSRRHAALSVTDGVVTVHDLGSHNGTIVNGAPLRQPRPLSSGDVVAIGDTLLVLHCESRTAQAAAVDGAQFQGRLDLEVERAIEFGRPLSLALLQATPGDGRRLLGAARPALRRLDLLSLDGQGRLQVLMPELDKAAGERLLAALLAGPLASVPGVRGRVVGCPEDGSDGASLLSAALEQGGGESGDGRSAAPSPTRMALGDRSVLVADPAMSRLFSLIRRLSPSPLPVLICGETGAGKENAAYAVHAFSPRAAGPFVPINCAAIPDNLVESELFGHEKGAFSGAAAAKPGLLETAAGGTVFLDELGDLPLPLQAKLLRVLETGSILRVGALRERSIDIRLVAATHKDLEAEVEAGRFRKDLFFRLATATVVLPPLRDRPREVPLLAQLFLAEACQRLGRAPLTLSTAVLRFFARYPFPGNVRELKNAMEFAAAATEGGRVEVAHLPPRMAASGAVEAAAMPAQPSPEGPAPTSFRPLAEELRELERLRVSQAYAAAGYVQTRAAELIGMPLRTFIVKLKQFGLAPPEGHRRPAAKQGPTEP